MSHRIVRSLALVAALTAFGAASAAEAAESVHLYLKANGKPLTVNRRGEPEGIAVIAVSHEIVSPRDAASGLPTGKRQHKPFVITKELDKSTPLLYQALVTNENITADLVYTKTNARGRDVVVYTVHLENGSIAGIAAASEDRPDGTHHDVESIQLTYQKIDWTWSDGGVTASDDWGDRN